MNTNLKLFIFAGEPSGDLHGSYLLQELKSLLPHLQLSGVGGSAMRSQGLNCFLPMEDFAVMGFTDVLKSLPQLWRQFYQVRNHILAENPNIIVLIDYPGFNLRLAKSLRKKGFSGSIIHYIAPSVWAHGKMRIQQMAENLDRLFTIFPFESHYFAQTPLKVDYVGNPLQEYLNKYQYDPDWLQKMGISKQKHLAALFPGSRTGEIKRNLPAMLQAAALLKKEYPDLCFVISYADEQIKSSIQSLIQKETLQDIFLIPKQYTYEMMRDSRFAIAKSGTVTLELALHTCPTVVVYRLTLLNRFFAKVLLRLKLPHYCLVNILCGQRVFPELIEFGFSKENIYHHAKLLHISEAARATCKSGCEHVQKMLDGGRASETAARKIAELLACQN